MVPQPQRDQPVSRKEAQALGRSVALLWKRSRRLTLWLLAYRSTAVVSVVAAAVSVLAAIAAWLR